jgi:hypothetical protein
VIVSTLASYTTADILGGAYNGSTGKGWFSKNGVYASGDPDAGTGEHFTFTPGTVLFAAFTLFDFSPADQVTVNFGATAFNTAPPSGFSAWNANLRTGFSQNLSGKELLIATVSQTFPKLTQNASGTITVASVTGTVESTFPKFSQQVTGEGAGLSGGIDILYGRRRRGT